MSSEVCGGAAIRLVYVEDDERLARLTAHYLSGHGVEACTGLASLASVESVRWELVFLPARTGAALSTNAR